jgi:hypothetical protein
MRNAEFFNPLFKFPVQLNYLLLNGNIIDINIKYYEVYPRSIKPGIKLKLNGAA